jgi:ubiquinone/menaquinone biosynthesis C-methylase UbiE
MIVLGAAATAVLAATRHGGSGRQVAGGIVMNDSARYDLQTRLLMGSFFDGVVADVVAHARDGARVLEVGCGPGHLSGRLARRGLVVTGVDLDPAMIERARANAERASQDAGRRPSFVVGDVAALPFPDASFDLVVSTLSLHHWADKQASLTEIARVLSPGGRALVWDLRPGVVPLHRHTPDPVAQVVGSSLRLASASPWRWPWRLALTQRIELAKPDETA